MMMPEQAPEDAARDACAHSYPRNGSMATPCLREKIRRSITEYGPIPFSQFMETALYDEEHGYYRSNAQRVGKQGDFITSVSVGKCFGLILAHRLLTCWQKMDKPDHFHIIEPGAHDGALCCDILTQAKAINDGFYDAIEYHLIEKSPTLLASQRELLGEALLGKTHHHASLTDLSNLTGVIISNELIDAFPAERLRFQDGKWHQLFVHNTNDEFTFINQDLSTDELKHFCASLGNNFPDGYLTEFHPSISHFLATASTALKKGHMITIDYGHLADDYYHPDRTTGTLQTFHRHQKSDDPLTSPGETDITCHVDFTQLITLSESAGFTQPSLETQASYLTKHARPWLLSLENSTSPETVHLIRQFQTLTHPSMLGTKFQVLEMTKGL